MEPIFMDVDGVLADFAGSVIKYYDLPRIDPPYWDWVIDAYKKKYPDETEKSFWAGLEEDFWINLPELPEAKDILKLVKRFGEPVLLTCPTWFSAGYRQAWIRKHYPDMFYSNRYIISPGKKYLSAPGRVLIDDSDQNIADWRAHGGSGILVPGSYNRNRGKDILRTVDHGLVNIFFFKGGNHEVH